MSWVCLSPLQLFDTSNDDTETKFIKIIKIYRKLVRHLKVQLRFWSFEVCAKTFNTRKRFRDIWSNWSSFFGENLSTRMYNYITIYLSTEMTCCNNLWRIKKYSKFIAYPGTSILYGKYVNAQYIFLHIFKGNVQFIFLCNPQKPSVNVFLMKILKSSVIKNSNCVFS